MRRICHTKINLLFLLIKNWKSQKYMSSIPIISGNTRPSCCHPSAPLKDAVFSSADIKKNASTCRLRAECAVVVNLRSDRITAEDINTNVLVVNQQLIVPPPPIGNFEGSGDSNPFSVTGPEVNTWVVLPDVSLSWIVDGLVNDITSSGNTLVFNRDGYYSLSLNLNYTLSITTPPVMIGWIVNGTDPSFPLFRREVDTVSYVDNATVHLFLASGSTLQLGINTPDAANTIIINDAHLGCGFMGST